MESLISIQEIRDTLSGKTHLSITEAAAYLGVSRPTVYARIKAGELVPVRFSTRTLRIPIDQLIDNTEREPQPSKGDFSTIISKEEALERYEITDTWLYRKLKQEGIRPKIIKGKAFFPEKDLDRLFPPKKTFDRSEWYDVDELAEREGKTRKYVTNLIRVKEIRSYRNGKTLLVSKAEWDNGRITRGDISENYLTVDQARKLYHIGQKTFYDGVNAAGLQGIRQERFVYYSKRELDRLFKKKPPKIPADIRKNYIRSGDVLKHYHIGQKRFLEETKAAGVTKVKIAGNQVWYKKSEMDALFKKINDGSN